MPRLPKNKPGVTVPRETPEDTGPEGGGRFKLLAGQHQQADPDWEPTPAQEKVAERTGVPPRPPTKTFTAGQVVESDKDLVALFGHQKFMRLGGRKPLGATRGDAPSAQPASFPGGQVSSGRQEATSFETEEGEAATVSGPMDPKKSARLDRESELEDEPDDGTAENALNQVDDEVEDKANLADMTVAELKDVAVAEDVDLAGIHKKDEIIAKIKKGRRRR
jgi:hypothetical protein